MTDSPMRAIQASSSRLPLARRMDTDRAHFHHAQCKKSILTFHHIHRCSLVCDNEPPAKSVYAVCENGIVEEGEMCDCGSADCWMIDKFEALKFCLNRHFETMSSSGAAMESCADYLAMHNVQTWTNAVQTDIKAEFCDGVSAECPFDAKYIEGTK